MDEDGISQRVLGDEASRKGKLGHRQSQLLLLMLRNVIQSSANICKYAIVLRQNEHNA